MRHLFVVYRLTNKLHLGESMKLFLLVMSSMVLGNFAFAQTVPQCAGAQMGKNSTDLVWSHPDAIGKMVVVKNLDTNLVYPKDTSYKAKGTISLKDLLPNKKGYALILVDLTEQSLADVKAATQKCVQRGDCSMSEKSLKAIDTPCSWLEFLIK